MEPAGEAHTLVITENSPEPALVMFVVEGGLIYLDKPTNGGVAAYEDGFTLLELCRKYHREAGLDARELDLLIRSLSHAAAKGVQPSVESAFQRPQRPLRVVSHRWVHLQCCELGQGHGMSRVDPRAGHYERKLETKAGAVVL